jgi:serine-type D-Ala-D-Ala endopeptidase (penicillin-binding protein 7)
MKKRFPSMSKACATTTKVIAALALTCSAAFAQVSAVSYIVIAQDGRVLAEHNADEIRPMASMTKLVTLSEVRPVDSVVFITADEKDTIKGTRMRLRYGSYIQSELLDAALISSNNEAAKAVGRSVPNLIADVNKKNLERGLQLSVVEPSGLDPANVGNARSLARLAWMIKDEPAAGISVSPGGRLAGHSTNSLIGSKGWEFSLSKTGYIKEAGGCLVTLTKMGGEWVAVALMGSKSVRERWIDLARIRKQVAPDDTFYEPGIKIVKRASKRRGATN